MRKIRGQVVVCFGFICCWDGQMRIFVLRTEGRGWNAFEISEERLF